MAKNHFFKARGKSLVGILLLFAVIVTVIAVSPMTDASAASSGDGAMTITGNLVLEWRTDSTGNTNPGRHFRTTYWTFTVYKKGSSKPVEEPVTVPVDVMLNEKGTSSDGFTMAYKWNLKDTAAKDYKKYAQKLVDAINSVEGDVTIIANPTIEFYDSSKSPESIYKTGITTKSEADSTAHKFFGNNKSYFDNYFNKNVKIEMVRIRVKTKAGDTDSINGINIGSGVTIDKIPVTEDTEAAKSFSKKTKVTTSVWYALSDNATPEITVIANKGYVFAGAESTTTVSVDMETTQYGNGSGKTGKLTTNTSIAVEADPVQVKIVYYIDEDGSGNYVKAGTVTYTYDHIPDDGSAQIGYGIDTSVYDLNYYTTWTYTNNNNGEKLTYNSGNVIDNGGLYQLWLKSGNRDTVTHTVKLYAEGSNPPAGSDYRIVYDGNGATSGSMADQYATYGTTTMLKTNAYTKTGYHTDKDDAWVSEKNSVTYAEAQSVSDATLDFDDEDRTVVTLDANWKPNECTIVYNGNGATSGTVKKQTITYDDWTETLRENAFSKTGTSFDSKQSWNTEPDGSGTAFTPGTKVTKSVWKKLFGSYDANGVKITLYAVWGDKQTDTPRETWELESLTGGQLTYVNPLDNDTDGPYTYGWTGSLSLLECMFGTKYSTATTEYVTYDTGFQTTTEQQMFMITAGSTIYKGDADEDWYKFEGWSIDEYAQYGDSDSIILAAGQTMSGEDLGAYAMAYKYPIKYNNDWDTMTLDEMMESGGVPEPTSTLLPSKSNPSKRADVISEAAKAWKTYRSLLESEVTSSTTEYNDAADAYDDAKAAYEEAVDAYEAAEAAYNSAVSYLDSVKSQKPAQDSASYSSWYTSYSDAQSNVSSTKSAMNKAKTAMDKAENEMDKAEEEMDTWEGSVDSYTDTYNSLIKQINNTISDTKLYAVWDKFPVFKDMDEIAINEVDITGISDLASWLWQYVTVTDREDITLTNGTDVVLENKNTLIAELQQLEHTGSISVTFKATDSAGNVTRYTTNIWMNDKDPLQTNVLAERINYENGYTRFISREYYELGNPDNFSSEQEYLDRYVNATGLHTNEDGSTTVVPYYLYCGGLHPKSLWYTDPEYKAEILNAFDNEENGTPEEVWTFTYDDIQDIKAYIDTYGIGDTYGEGRLKNFYNTFKHCCTVYKQPFQDTYGK